MPASQVGEVAKMMGKKKCLVKVGGDGKYVVDVDRKIDIKLLTPNTRVACKHTSFMIHKILPSKIAMIGLNFSKQETLFVIAISIFVSVITFNTPDNRGISYSNLLLPIMSHTHL